MPKSTILLPGLYEEKFDAFMDCFGQFHWARTEATTPGSSYDIMFWGSTFHELSERERVFRWMLALNEGLRSAILKLQTEIENPEMPVR